jgi:hypothetical protein
MKYDTFYNFVNYFPTLQRLFTPYFGYGGFPTMSFFVGFGSLISVFLGFVFFVLHFKKINKENKIIFLWSLITLSVSMFMMNYRSTFIWNAIPLLPYFQFPWRFLMIVVYISPVFLITLNETKYRSLIALGLGIFAIVGTVGYFHPQDFLGRTDAYYLNRYIPYPVASSNYQQIDLEMPKSLEKMPDKNYPVAYSDGNEIKNITVINSLSSVIQTNSTNSFTLNYSKYNFPGWNATLDGKNIQIKSGQPFGQISLTVPAGIHTVKIFFRETTLNIILDILSLGTILYCLSLAIKSKK